MRFILVDHAWQCRDHKRGGGQEIVSLDDLPKADAREARVVEMRLFAGLAVDEWARLLCVSVETIGRDWGASERSERATGAERGAGVPASESVGGAGPPPRWLRRGLAGARLWEPRAKADGAKPPGKA
jgi:hypothetical protein